jgi:hypothetical protein
MAVANVEELLETANVQGFPVVSVPEQEEPSTPSILIGYIGRTELYFVLGTSQHTIFSCIQNEELTQLPDRAQKEDQLDQNTPCLFSSHRGDREEATEEEDTGLGPSESLFSRSPRLDSNGALDFGPWVNQVCYTCSTPRFPLHPCIPPFSFLGYLAIAVIIASC